ncbi:hypothetical protein [Paraburkholderia sp. SIMBA_030]|uniref:hypothetical protein n=1 Tax=Paraburkholderia sp. SIMBA_030 TaxID=3085773 RepID=UPI00397C5EC9
MDLFAWGVPGTYRRSCFLARRKSQRKTFKSSVLLTEFIERHGLLERIKVAGPPSTRAVKRIVRFAPSKTGWSLGKVMRIKESS